MRRSLSLVVVVVVAVATTALVVCLAELAQATAHSSLQEWRAYKQKYGKVYESPEEDARRFALFLRSKAKIAMLRGAGESHKRGLNHLSDWTEDEFRRLNGLRLPREPQLLRAQLKNSPEAERFLQAILSDNSTSVPDELDWREVTGRVSPVKDQKHCGSCWAFATTGVLEGQQLVRNFTLRSGNGKQLTPLSEQDLIDCSQRDNGCDGGLMDHALNDIAEMGGIESEEAYPYVGNSKKTEACRFSRAKSVMSDKGSSVLPQFKEDIIKQVVAKYGPVSVAIDADNLQDYESGIYKGEKCFSEVNHGVLIVGYGTDQTHGDYWIIKNSWNESWGEQGYFRMSRNKNTCYVGFMPVIATF